MDNNDPFIEQSKNKKVLMLKRFEWTYDQVFIVWLSTSSFVPSLHAQLIYWLPFFLHADVIRSASFVRCPINIGSSLSVFKYGEERHWFGRASLWICTLEVFIYILHCLNQCELLNIFQIIPWWKLMNESLSFSEDCIIWCKGIRLNDKKLQKGKSSGVLDVLSW